MVSPRLVGCQCQDLGTAGDVPGMCGGGGHSHGVTQELQVL